MLDEQTRINAMISYLFLAPFFLLAREGTPLAHPFVRAHAKKGSLFLLIGGIAYAVFFFVKPFLSFSFFGINISVALLSLLIGILLIALLVGAYRAYHGVAANDIRFQSLENLGHVGLETGTYSEEDKIRIIASFLPGIGIFMAEKYPQNETKIGRKVGNILTCIFFLALASGGSGGPLLLIITMVYIALIVMTAVYLFLEGKFLSPRIYDSIPSYREFEAMIKAGLLSFFEFIRVAFGGEKRTSFSIIKKNSIASSYEEDTRGALVEWIFLIILLAVGIWYFGKESSLLLILLFPLFTLIAERKNTSIRAPIVSLGADIVSLFSHTKKQVQELSQKTVEEKFIYPHAGEEKEL